jgi:hypothetical protein
MDLNGPIAEREKAIGPLSTLERESRQHANHNYDQAVPGVQNGACREGLLGALGGPGRPFAASRLKR